MKHTAIGATAEPKFENYPNWLGRESKLGLNPNTLLELRIQKAQRDSRYTESRKMVQERNAA